MKNKTEINELDTLAVHPATLTPPGFEDPRIHEVRLREGQVLMPVFVDPNATK